MSQQKTLRKQANALGPTKNLGQFLKNTFPQFTKKLTDNFAVATACVRYKKNYTNIHANKDYNVK